MNKRVEVHGLKIAQSLYDFVREEVIPDTGVDVDEFWSEFASIVKDLAPKNRALLQKRDHLQQQINEWHLDKKNKDADLESYKSFLVGIGYLVPEGAPYRVSVERTDNEITKIAGPQLVVPVDNARYALNAANARWGSLYDALYGTDIIPETQGCKRTSNYNPVRGMKVIAFARQLLDHAAPMAVGSHSYVVKYLIKSSRLVGVMGDGTETGLGKPERFVGYTGKPESPKTILLEHNKLHIEIRLGENSPISRHDLAKIYDVQIESAISAIMDCEDSVAAVDTTDKLRLYKNWLGLMKGDLSCTVIKAGKKIERKLEMDRKYIRPNGKSFKLRGRALMLLRNVGMHMYTDIVTTADNQEIPEGFLDAMVTILAAKHDIQGKGTYNNSPSGSIHIVKPKMHGPEEVTATVELFARIEKALDLKPLTVKLGIMDEERRTTVNLKECIRAAEDRVIFINTGFLDRTGDEIHTSMEAGPMLPKAELKKATWLLAYEDWNVDIGLEVGLPRKAQIGKGMWAEPENMAAMMDTKVNHPRAGANCAWVPSPTAATLHAIHYHRVNVGTRQRELIENPRARLDDILTLPLLDDRKLDEATIRTELENNAQGILGYVVRWIQQGVGCSKVLDIHNTALMEDRATLRISSQILANWLHHNIVSKEQLMAIFKKMAAIVDHQNADDPAYIDMYPNFDESIAFQAALDLVFTGVEQPNGYTEAVLHRRRREFKQFPGEKDLSSRHN
jgi:malate synthase